MISSTLENSCTRIPHSVGSTRIERQPFPDKNVLTYFKYYKSYATIKTEFVMINEILLFHIDSIEIVIGTGIGKRICSITHA